MKVLVKKLVLDEIPYAKAQENINKQIKECLDEIDSPELKITAEQTLRAFASNLMITTLASMGVTTNLMLIAIGKYKSGQTTSKIVQDLTTISNAEISKFFITPENANLEDVRYSHKFQVGDVPVKNVGELGVANNEYGKVYMERVKKALEQIIASEPKYESNVSLRNIAEMTVRYETTLKKLDDLRARGVNLITTNRHENCSKRCEKWQGGHYTLDNTYQTVDGIQFIPLSVATDQYVTTKSGKTYKNGHLTGYNCRHYAIPYQKGVEPPMVDKRTIERQRAIDKRMRELERLIRHWKEKVAMYENVKNFTKELQDAKLKVRYWKKQYEAFCKANQRAIEPSRIQIF